MYIYKVKTAELAPHLSKMQITQNEKLLLDAGLDKEETQLLKKTVPCGLKILAARDCYGMEMGTVKCGNHNIDPDTTELCDACHAVFENVSGECSLTIERLGDMVQAKPLSCFEKCKKFAKDHPYLSAAAVIAMAAFPVVCGLMAYGLAPAELPTTAQSSNPKTPTTTPIPAIAQNTTPAPIQPTTTIRSVPTAEPTPNTNANYSVIVQEASTLGGKDTVILTTRVTAPEDCYTAIDDVDLESGVYTGTKVTNKCEELLLVTPMEKDEVICVIEREATQVCNSSSPSPQFSYSSGSRSIKFTSDERPSIKAEVTQEGDLTIFLPNAKEVKIPTASNGVKAPTASKDAKAPSQDCIKVETGGYTLECKNACEETVLLSVFTSSSTDVETFMMEPQERQLLPEDVTRLTENTNIPTVIQKPAIVK